jgi:hypothetical protein
MKKELQAKTARSRTEFRMVQGEMGLFDPSKERLLGLVVERIIHYPNRFKLLKVT